jgi:SAM-dependent MidA family methyltransferase
LLRPLLEALDSMPDKVLAIDASPASRRALAEAGFETAADLADVSGPLNGVIVANELLDNLPMRLAVRSDAGWHELWVGAGRAELELVKVPARVETVDWLEAYAGPVPDGGVVEVQLEAATWLRSALDLLEAGSVVVIDYGATAEELAPRRAIGTLRTYRAHHLGPDPLLEPGTTDITADVNFTALLDVARQAGLSATLHRQDDFLASLGLRETMAELRRRELELAAGDDAMARLTVRSELKDAETLLHPRGLGDFRVLVAEKGSQSGVVGWGV